MSIMTLVRTMTYDNRLLRILRTIIDSNRIIEVNYNPAIAIHTAGIDQNVTRTDIAM